MSLAERSASPYTKGQTVKKAPPKKASPVSPAVKAYVAKAIKAAAVADAKQDAKAMKKGK